MIERQTAKKCRIIHLINGKYVQKEGWDPNYFETSIGNLSRVNIIATVVGKENNAFILDDGSGKIVLRSFESVLNFEIGDSILVIGRPRVYNYEPYIASEIAKKISDSKWLEHRQIEINAKFTVEKNNKKKVKAVKEEIEIPGDLRQSDEIIDLIRKEDKGEGVDIEEVLKKVKDEKTVDFLLKEGEIFEVRPGKVKVLD